MVNEDQSVFITNVLLELSPTGNRQSPFAPVVRAGDLHVRRQARDEVAEEVEDLKARSDAENVALGSLAAGAKA